MRTPANGLWKTYTIDEEPKPTKKNAKGLPLYGPSGVAIWSSPTVDLARGAVYAATGNSYSEPAADTNDSVLAFDLASGKLWQDFTTVNGVPSRGGTINAPGPTIAGGMLFTNSGYGMFGGAPGNVLLAFGVE